MGWRKKHSRSLLFGMAVIVLGLGTLTAYSKKSEAQLCIPPAFCDTGTLLSIRTVTAEILAMFHETAEQVLVEHITLNFNTHRTWLTDVFFKTKIKPAMQNMTQQLAAVSMHQTAMMGMFLDAKQQLETQRLFQELQAEAQRDYQPSEDFCWFGTAARSLSATDSASKFHAAALSARQMKRHLRNKDNKSSDSSDTDKLARFAQFQKAHCDPKDHNYSDKGTGLDPVCSIAGPRPNMDVDYTRLIEDRRTLGVSFDPSKASTGDDLDDEHDVIALGNNLYGHTPIKIYEEIGDPASQELYMALRALTAKRNVAENSFNSIVALKSRGNDPMTGAAETSKYLGAILAELGMPATEITGMIGENPSYYAQLEILAKKIYQNPDFFSNLYDTPANVARKSVALRAIDLMLDRAIYESQLRQEMVTSVLLAHRLRKEFDNANSKLSDPGAK